MKVINPAAAARRNLWFSTALFGVVGVLALATWTLPVLGAVFVLAAALFGWGAARTRRSEVFTVGPDGIRCVEPDGEEWFLGWSALRTARVGSQLLTSPVSGRTAPVFCLDLLPADGVDPAAGPAHRWSAEDGMWRVPLPPGGRTMHRLTRAVRGYRR